MSDGPQHVLVAASTLRLETWLPFTDPTGRLYWPYLGAAVVLALLVGSRAAVGERSRGRPGLWDRRLWLHPSSRTDALFLALQSVWRLWWVTPWALSTLGTTVALVGWLDTTFGARALPAWLSQVPTWAVMGVYTVVLFVAWDASRFWLHRAMHRFAWLWQFHQVHHSASVLTPLTLRRVHPVESLLYAIRGTLVTASLSALWFYWFRTRALQFELLGVNAIGCVFNLAGSNLRHSPVWWTFGRRIESFFISPAQHQMHHSAHPDHCDVNYGTWLACWDRLTKTHRFAADTTPPERFGLAQCNHDPTRFGSSLAGPFVALARRLRGHELVSVALLASLWPSLTFASNGAQPTPDDSGDDEEVYEFGFDDELVDENENEDEHEHEHEHEHDDGIEKSDKTLEPAASVPAADTDVPSEAEREALRRADVITDTVSILGSQVKEDRIAGSAHVLDEEALERYEYDDIHRVLRQVPGVYIREEDGLGLRPNIGLRGANSDRSAKVTLMEDGVLLAPAPYSAPAAYYFPLTMRIVGVEVFKGPAATRHGPNTIGGALNLQTRGIPVDPRIHLEVAGGTLGDLKLHGFAGTSWRRGGILAEVAHLRGKGFKVLDGGGPTGYERLDAMLKTRLHSDPNALVVHQVDLRLATQTEESNETYLGLTNADFAASPYRRYAASQDGRMQWWRLQGQLQYFMTAGSDFELQVTAYRHDFDRSWRKLNDFRDGPPLSKILANPTAGRAAVFHSVLTGERDTATRGEQLMIGDNARRYVSQGVALVSHWRPIWGLLEQDIELGARFHYDMISRNHTALAHTMQAMTLVPTDEAVETTTLNRGEAFAGAFHLHDRLDLWRFSLTPGIRFEVIRTRFRDDLQSDEALAQRENSTFVTLPGVGLQYQALDWLGAFAGVHSGFSPVAPGQPDEVEPERSVNYEVGVRATHDDRGKLEAVGFVNDYRNLTGECTFSSACTEADLNRQFNGGEVLVYGLEVAGNYQFDLPRRHWLMLSGNYTWTASEFAHGFNSSFPQFGAVSKGDALPYVPEHLASLQLGAGNHIWQLSTMLNYVGWMRDTAGQGEYDPDVDIPSYVVLDVTAAVQVAPMARVHLRFDNVTNRKYISSRRPFGARPGRPFAASLGLEIDLDLARRRRK